MKASWVVVLKLSRLSVPQKIEKARFIVQSMTGNVNFTTPFVSLAAITAAVNALEQANINAEGGGKDETALKQEKMLALNHLLLAEGNYVEATANANMQRGESIILSAGMEPKQVSVLPGSSFRVQNHRNPRAGETADPLCG